MLLVTALLVGGGALADTVREIPFKLPPSEAKAKIPGADSVGVKLSVSDQRVDKTRIGASYAKVTTMFGGSEARAVIVPKEPLIEVLEQGARAEVGGRGYLLGNGPAYLLIDVQELNYGASSVDRNVEYTFDAGFEVKILDAAGSSLYSEIFKKRETPTWRMASDNPSPPPSFPKFVGDLIADIVVDPEVSAALFKANGK